MTQWIVVFSKWQYDKRAADCCVIEAQNENQARVIFNEAIWHHSIIAIIPAPYDIESRDYD